MASILLVCTGNICRSPMAEALLDEQFTRRRIHSVQAGSAGTHAGEGDPATDGAVEAMRDRQLDLSGHRARRLTPDLIEAADLVIGMAAEHREAVKGLVPDAEGRTFTLKELVRLLDDFLGPGDAAASAEERLRRGVARAERRRGSGPQAALASEDIADPLGLSLPTYLAVAWELDGLIRRMADHLFGEGWTEGLRLNSEVLWGTATEGA